MNGIPKALQMTDEDGAKAQRLYEAGRTTYEIAATMNRDPGAIARALRKRGVVLRKGTRPKRNDLRTRLLARAIINPETCCWEWAGAKTPEGYGRIKRDGAMYATHREAYRLWFAADVPEGLEIDHLCRVRNCLNPDHLEAVTGRTNKLRSEGFAGLNAAKTHCDSGHEFTPENTYITPAGARSCRECKRENWRESYRRDPEKFAVRSREARLRDIDATRAKEREKAARRRAGRVA